MEKRASLQQGGEAPAEHQQEIHTSSTGSPQPGEPPEIEIRSPGGGLHRVLARLSNGEELDVVADGLEDLVARLVVAIEAAYRQSPPPATRELPEIEVMKADDVNFVGVGGAPIGKSLPPPLSLFVVEWLQDNAAELMRVLNGE